MLRSDLLRKESQAEADRATVRELERFQTDGGPNMASAPPRWRIRGGPWLEYNEGGPYPRQPRAKRAPTTREMPLTDLLPKRGPTPEPEPAPPEEPNELERERKLRLAAEKARDSAIRRAEKLEDKLKRNEAAITTMLGSIGEMEAAIEEDRLQDAKRECILHEEQERVRELTVRLHKTQGTLAMLQHKYGDEGSEQDSGTSLRAELMQLRADIKNEQAAAHKSREQMSRERKGRILAEARVAELQRYIDGDAEVN